MSKMPTLVLGATVMLLGACTRVPAPAASGAPSAGASAAADKSYPGQGVIKGFQDSGKLIVLKHQAIPGLMEGMTMAFELKDPSLAQGFAVGDSVDFTLTVHGDDWVVTQLKRP